MIIQVGSKMDVKNMEKAPVVEKNSPIKAISEQQHSAGKDSRVSTKTVASTSTKSSQKTADLNKVVQKLNEHAQIIERELHFSVDKKSGEMVVKVIDMATKKVIRQIPSKEALNVANRLKEGAGLKLFSGYT